MTRNCHPFIIWYYIKLLRRISNLYTDPIKGEVTRGVAGNWHKANAEIRIAEIGRRPCAAPGIGHCAYYVYGFGSGKCG